MRPTPAGAAPPTATTRPPSTRTSPTSTTGGASERTTVPPLSSRGIVRSPARRAPAALANGPPAGEPVQGTGHRGRRRDEDRLPCPLRPVRAFRLGLLDEDALDRWHRGCGDDPQRLQRLADRAAILAEVPLSQA